MSGRSLTITDGGQLVFHETNANGNFVGTITLNGGNLTANRTYILPDQDCVLGGLAPGQYWTVDKGGTGFNTAAKNRVVVGSGTTALGLVDAPTDPDTFLAYDSVLDTLRWAPIDFSGTENTTMINLSNTLPGWYSSKLGTQLRLKNFETPDAYLTVVDNNNRLTLTFNQSAISLPFNQVTGVVPIAQGGLGLTSIGTNQQILVSNGTGYTFLPAPPGPGMYLRTNANTGTFEWSHVTIAEHHSGEIRLPTNSEYLLSLKWPYACSLDEFLIEISTGSISFQLIKGTTVLASGNVVAGTPVDQVLTGQTLAPGDRVKLVFSNMVNVAKADFTMLMTRS